MLLDADGKALEVCAGGKTNPEVYQTSIPTSAIRAGKTDYVHIMNIYDWGAPHGRWLTNFLLSILPMMTVGHGSGVKR